MSEVAEFDSEDFVIQADVQLELLAHRAQLLVLPEAARQDAAAKCAPLGVDADCLHKEWLNECLGLPDLYDLAVADPTSHFAAWLEDRIAHPYRVSVIAQNAAEQRLGLDFLRFNMGVWDQEIAWAHRLRRSHDVATAILCDLFLRAARRDTVKQFNALVSLFAIETESFDYMIAKEHDLSPAEIRSGLGSEKFFPLFLRHARTAFEKQLMAVMDRDDVDKIAGAIRLAEEKDMQAALRERAILKLERTPLIWMPSIIRAAIDIGLDSDWLRMAYEVFIGQVRSGEIMLPASGGIPHAEFLTWLRLQRFKRRPKNTEPILNQKNVVLGRITENPREWFERLPEEYRDLGARRAMTYKLWISPIVSNVRRAPMDFVLDYGFHLVQEALARTEG